MLHVVQSEPVPDAPTLDLGGVLTLSDRMALLFRAVYLLSIFVPFLICGPLLLYVASLLQQMTGKSVGLPSQTRLTEPGLPSTGPGQSVPARAGSESVVVRRMRPQDELPLEQGDAALGAATCLTCIDAYTMCAWHGASSQHAGS